MSNIQKLLLSICLIGLAGCSVKASLKDENYAIYPSWEEGIERLALKEIEATGIPSLQIAIGKEGDIVFEKAYGYSNVEEKTPATINTQYRTASISKWFTGTATMKLVDEGKLDISEPIQTYCPEFPKKEWEITTRHLLSHTSGIRHYKEGEAENPSTDRYTDVIGPLASFKHDPLEYEPATDWRYSSHGYRVLGCVIRGASQTSYNDYLEKSVFTPSGMTATVQDDVMVPTPQRANGYELTGRKKLTAAPVRDLSENIPAGGHLSTASDLIRFSQSFDQGKLVSADSIAFMSSSPITKTGEVVDVGYGHGVDFMGAFAGSLGHSGRQEGTTTLLVLLPDEDLSIAVMTNARGWRNRNEFTQKVLGTYKNGQRP